MVLSLSWISEIKADLCSEWEWWLESSVLTLEGQEKGLLAKRQKEDFGAPRMPFQDFTI